MVTDSAISRIINGRISRCDQLEWRKLLWVPHIKAGISYWGFIGKVTRQRFDEWLEYRIRSSSYNDLPGLADFLAQELNDACKNRPLGNDEQVGIHLAGYHEWQDGVRRPVFYHVHNGHCHVQWRQHLKVSGLFAGPPLTIQADPVYQLAPRGLFSRNDDFPKASLTLPQNLTALSNGYTTRNGDFATYILISDAIKLACISLGKSPGVSVPADPTKLGPRLGYLKMLLEVVSHIYKCSTMPRIVGGKISSLGIKPNETRLV